MLLVTFVCSVVVLHATQSTMRVMTSHGRCKQNYIYDIWN